MIYVFSYLVIGVLVLIGVGVDHMRRLGERSEWDQAREKVRRARQSWFVNVLERWIIAALAGATIILAWPFAIVFVAHFYLRRAKPDEPDAISELDEPDVFDEPEGLTDALRPNSFRVNRSHLLKRTTLADIERSEIVADPLESVPDKPFGHLFPAWLEFKRQLLPHDEIWSFRAEWGQYGRTTEMRSGYAVVRADAVGPHFTKAIRPVENGATPEQNSWLLG